MKVRFVFGIVFSLLCLSSAALAQNYRGSIRGRITDPNRSAIKGVAVKATNTDTGETRSTTSTAAGEYNFSLLPLGAYQLQFDKSGFKHYKINLQLSVNQDMQSDLT
ncbi:MAG: carboxypeptidase-like regulatory domain-containing protein, partial [Acidobacteriota bacterium]